MSSSELKKDIKRAAKKVLPDPAIRKIRAYRKARKGSEPKPNTYRSSQTYTVVTAVYNVEAYLDDFFTSLYNQTMLKESIRIIAVDDGSTDSSAEIIKRWQDRWPGAITYLKKENGGQASARNLGMDHTESEWVTFIDPDDFVSKRYFEEVDRAIVAWPSVQMVSCNCIIYYENERRYANTHPLRGRFAHGDQFFAAGDDRIPVQFAMNSVFMKMSLITSQGLCVSEEVYPNFEDGHFVNKYLLNLANDGTVGFLNKPRYYYRKRSDGSSTLDISWTTLDRILRVPKHGYLDLLQYAEQVKGYVPQRIQDAILYDLSYTIKRFLNHPERNVFVKEAGKEEAVWQLMRSIFSYIDAQSLFSFPGHWLHFGHKCGIAQSFMNVTPPYHIAYLRMIDFAKKEMLIETCSDSIIFRLDGKALTPTEKKKVDHPFFGSTLYSSYELWFSFDRENQVLSYAGESREPVRLTVDGRQFEHSVSMRMVIKRYTRNWFQYEQNGSSWIIMDRDTQADDNGEHFYRYMMQNHPEQRCLFVLRKESPDWERLAREGFNLLAFGSRTHESELRQSSTIISSQADPYVHSYFGDNFHKSKKFVFLQHGIIKDDLSSWLNGKPISLMVTTTEPEYRSIIHDGSPYVFTPRQILLSGLPRHDALLKTHLNESIPQNTRHAIVIAPTWRASLVGSTSGSGNHRKLNDSFAASEYKQSWESFLNSPTLKIIAEDASCEILFVPHANIVPYIEACAFSVPDYVTTFTSNGIISIQDCFRRASVCITDYSSMAFDVAFFGKECIFYQFDKEFFYGGAQVYARGYFNFEKDGFGPVVDNENDLLAELEKLAVRDFKPDDVYKKRMEETFIFRDGKCCERVYKAIMQLDEPRS